MIGDIKKGFYPENLRMYYLAAMWTMARSMLIIQCIIYFQTQSCIDITNFFSRADITGGEMFLNEVTRYVRINGYQFNFFLNRIKIFIVNIKPYIFGIK